MDHNVVDQIDVQRVKGVKTVEDNDRQNTNTNDKYNTITNNGQNTNDGQNMKMNR